MKRSADRELLLANTKKKTALRAKGEEGVIRNQLEAAAELVASCSC